MKVIGNVALVVTIGLAACSRPGDGQSNPAAPAAGHPAPRIVAAPFGQVGDATVQLYTLTNAHGLIARITNYGAIVTELHVPDRAGRLADIVLGFDSLDGYV